MKLKHVTFIMILGLFPIVTFAQFDSDSDTLQTASQMRPNDLLKGETEWSLTSVDQFTFWIDSGLYGFYGAQPKLFLDGMPIDINYFGWQNINTLPFNTGSVENTFSQTTPGIYSGSYAGAGAIDFQSAPVDSGLSLSASFYVGNESGDPGPYAYDSVKTTPNIDRWGPDGNISVSFKKEEWYAKSFFAFRNHSQTDLISNQRIHITASDLGTNEEYVNYKVQTTLWNSLLETGYSDNNWDLTARFLAGQDKDYLFLQAFGREIPAKTSFKQGALQGKYRSGNWEFTGRYTLHNKKIGKRFDLHTYIFDWNQTTHSLSPAASFSIPGLKINGGIDYERIQTQAPGIGEAYNDLASFFLDSEISISNSIGINLHGSIDYDESETAESFRVSIPVMPTSYWRITPEVFHSELLPLRQNSFPYWLTRGYTFGERLGITVSNPIEPLKSNITGLKLTNTIAPSANWELELKQKFIRHNALNIPWQIVTENEFSDTRPGQFTATREQGSRFQFDVRIINRYRNLLYQQISLKLQHSTSGSERYKEYFKQVPATQIGYKINVMPASSLNLSLGVDYRSSTKWNEYQALEGVEYILPSGVPIRPFSGTFHVNTPSFTNVTAGVQKWFWNRKINTQFSVQNLLNQEVRYHTMGAELFTKFNFKVGISL